MQIIFSHANGFPAGTYQALFGSLRARGFTVAAVERFGHDPKYPVTDNWPHLTRQLADFATAQVERAGEPVFLVGHSLGGFLSLMCAASHPRLARGVLLLDSPIPSGWRAFALGLLKRTRLARSLPPGRVSRKRKDHWPDAAATHAHFARKSAFARWEPQVLQDYVAHGTHDAPDGQRVLSFERAIETEIYNTLPDNLAPLLRRHPLRCPAAFIGGTRSRELRQAGMALTRRVVKGRIMMLEGSHLFPMEKPLPTAAAIEAALRGF